MERLSYPLTLWFLGTSLGVLIILGSVFGWLGMIAAGLLLVPLARRDRGAWAVAGAFTSFGAVWLFLTWSAVASGGQYEDLTPVIAIGVVPLVVGLALTASLAAIGANHVRAR